MYILLTATIILLSALLVLVILSQNPKGGGLSSQFGGSGASNLIGIKKTSDLLEKLTWGFAFAIMILSLAVHFTGTPTVREGTDAIIERAKEEQPLPDLNLKNPSQPPQDDNAAPE